MNVTYRCTSLAFLVVLSLLGRGDALFGKGKGGGGAVVSGKGSKAGASAASKIDPEALQAAAGQASERVMMWGTTTIFQLKAAVQLKGQVERLQSAAANQASGKGLLKMDPAMYKEIVGGALGGAFLMLNSPNMGKVSDLAKALMKDQRRQVRMVDLDQKVQESFAANKGKGGMTKGPKGFLEGALLDKQVAAAHDKFMADVEALSSSTLAKKVGSSAEAYHDALLVYATNEPAVAAAAKK